MQHFFSGMQEPDNLYTILLHFATLIAVCIVYWQDIIAMIVEFFRGLAALFTRRGGRETEPPAARRLVMLVILGTLPLVLVLPINDKLDALSSHPAFIACALMVTGFLLFFSDRMAKGRKTERTARVTDALLVGVARSALPRCLACPVRAPPSPPEWRWALTGSLSCAYSFLLSLPAVLGATLLQLIKTVKAGGHRHVSAAQVSGGYGSSRCGGLLLHPAGKAAGGQGQVRQVRLLLLGRWASWP